MLATTATRTRRRQRSADRSLVRKNMVMDQKKLDAAKKHLGVATETEAVDKALDMVAFQAEVLEGLKAAAALGPIEDVYRRR